jgi:hypothetical protein
MYAKKAILNFPAPLVGLAFRQPDGFSLWRNLHGSFPHLPPPPTLPGSIRRPCCRVRSIQVSLQHNPAWAQHPAVFTALSFLETGGWQLATSKKRGHR